MQNNTEVLIENTSIIIEDLEDAIDSYKGYLAKILKATNLAQAKEYAASALDFTPEDYLEDSDYIDSDMEELDFE